MSGPDHEHDFLEALKSVGPKPVVLPTLDAQTTSIVETVDKDAPQGDVNVPAPPGAVSASNIWRHPDAHPLVLDFLMLRRFGPEWLEWEGETLRHVIPLDFQTQTVSELNISKLQACRVLHMVDSFWQRWEVFIACCMPFNGEFPDFRIMQVPTVAQCLVAADTAHRIRDDMKWSTEMETYFSVVYKHDGIFYPIPPLDFVHIDEPEEFTLAALREHLEAWRKKDTLPKGDTALDEQVRRVRGATDYLEENRTRLHAQQRLFHG